jgi:hypothetical protein
LYVNEIASKQLNLTKTLVMLSFLLMNRHYMAMLDWFKKLDLGKIFQYYLSVMLLIDGTDKFFNLVTYWPDYLAPIFPQTLGVSTGVFLGILGVIEFAIGAIIWVNAKWGGLLVAALMLGISINLLVAGKFFNIVLVDIAVAIAALGLAQSTILSSEAQG